MYKSKRSNSTHPGSKTRSNGVLSARISPKATSPSGNKLELQRPTDHFALLCITPDQDVREEITRKMIVYGYRVRTEETRAGALQKCGHFLNYYHTIIIDDDVIGGHEGPEFAAYLRQRGYNGQVVVATYKITPASEEPYRKYNVHSFFRKEPMDVPRLASYLVEKR